MRAFAILIQKILPALWCGMILAIGFIEALLKFRDPGITRELGLGIGKLVTATIDRLFAGEIANKAKGKAVTIARAMLGSLIENPLPNTYSVRRPS